MEEKNVIKTVLLALPPAARMFRNNVGTGFIGNAKAMPNNRVIIFDARRLEAGLCKGSSDLIGWTSVEVTAEMVGIKLAVFTAIECKSKIGRVSPAQVNFLTQVKNSGGFAGVAKSEADIKNIIKF